MCQIEIYVQPTEKLDAQKTSDNDICELVLMCVHFVVEEFMYGDRKFFAPLIKIYRDEKEEIVEKVDVSMSGTYIDVNEAVVMMEKIREYLQQSSLAGNISGAYHQATRSF